MGLTVKFRFYLLGCRARELGAAIRHWVPSSWPVRGNTLRFCIGVYVLTHFVPAPDWAWSWATE